MAKVLQKAKSFYDIYERKAGANKDITHYCPGCGHGVLHKLIAEAIDDFEIRDRTILISPVGCSVFAYYYFRVGNIQVAHGRAPAAATGIKRVYPQSIVISYQGDGDLAAIGGNNIIQAANRGEKITVFFVNNAIYGMTGGQMAPTTIVGQKTTTSPYGRRVENEGFPVRMCELISNLEAPIYVERVALGDPKHTNKVRRAVRKGLKNQIENKGFSFVEVLSTCPSGWKMSPEQAKDWLQEEMIKHFPLGVYKDKSSEIEASDAKPLTFTIDNITGNLNIPVKETAAEKVEKEPVDKYRNPKLIIAGFGGQGVLMLGLGLAQAGMQAGYQVSWIPSYGPEMRGGTANCHVTLSTTRIGSPMVSKPSVLVAMNAPSLDKFEDKVVEEGIIIYNTSLIERQPKREDVQAIGIPATEIADQLGNTRVANMVVLGAYIGLTEIIEKETLFAALPQFIKRNAMIPLNKKAIEKGINFIKSM